MLQVFLMYKIFPIPTNKALIYGKKNSTASPSCMEKICYEIQEIEKLMQYQYHNSNKYVILP